VDHLLLHCPRAAMLWDFVFHSFGVFWLLPGRVVDLFLGWRNWFGKHSSVVWNLVPLCLMWTIWWERNQRIFDDKERSESQLLELFVISLFEWSRAWGFTTCCSIADFIDSSCLVHFANSL
jgi:hypothetical protein